MFSLFMLIAAKAVDGNRNNFLLAGNFLNVKINDEDKTK